MMEIKLAQSGQAEEIFLILRRCKHKLDNDGIPQWTDNYPVLPVVENDIIKRHLYCAILDGRCAGIITINDEQEPEYATVNWHHTEGNALVIHRLAVDPSHQGRGIAKTLMDFAELHGVNNKYPAVRLDAYSENGQVLRFYENRGYENRGQVYFPGRRSPFYCYEKSLLRS